MQQDYFGEELRSGDTIVRVIFSRLEPCIVSRVTDKAIFLITMGSKWDRKENKWKHQLREQRLAGIEFIKTDRVNLPTSHWDFYNELKENKKIKHEKCIFS